MAEMLDQAREVIRLLEIGATDALRGWRSPRLQDWSVEDWRRDWWLPPLNALAGTDRRIARAWQLSNVMARFVIDGTGGQAFVTVRFDSTGILDGLAIRADDRVAPTSVVIACPDDRRDELTAFYARLVSSPLWFGEGENYQPPRWPDPLYPQQVHLDITVADIESSDALVGANGATRLRDNGDHRVYADPIGHPFCLYGNPSQAVEPNAPPGVLARTVIDCPEPHVLAAFYQEILAMPVLVNDTEKRAEIAVADRTPPNLAFQRVENYRAPQWPDPAHPAQMHFDLTFDDRPGAEAIAIRHGAHLLPPQGGSCPVYADPAGHPFCACMPGE